MKRRDTKDPDGEVIADMERQIAEGTELEGYERVPASVSKNLSVTYAIRLNPEEYKAFADAARATGITVAELMRRATRAALAGELDVEKSALLGKARETARDLAETLGKL